MRGGESDRLIIARRAAGSSPHARGRDLGRADRRQREGFIPACAGESSNRRRSTTRAKVHPRMRGGEDRSRASGEASGGSSPHVRGRAAAVLRASKGAGFIPACAGERGRPRRGGRSTWVHPRMRGGELGVSRSDALALGSSPHARGRDRFPLVAPDAEGFIPACAGESGHRRAPRCSPRVHPRMRGGELRPQIRTQDLWGSSPHARGRVFLYLADITVKELFRGCRLLGLFLLVVETGTPSRYIISLGGSPRVK